MWACGLLPAGTHLLVQGLLLRNAVLPSRQLVDSGLATPAPLAFNLSSGSSGGSNASLVLDSCTVTTSCANLAQFAAWASGQQKLKQPYVKATGVGKGGWGLHAHMLTCA